MPQPCRATAAGSDAAHSIKVASGVGKLNPGIPGSGNGTGSICWATDRCPWKMIAKHSRLLAERIQPSELKLPPRCCDFVLNSTNSSLVKLHTENPPSNLTCKQTDILPNPDSTTTHQHRAKNHSTQTESTKTCHPSKYSLRQMTRLRTCKSMIPRQLTNDT